MDINDVHCIANFCDETKVTVGRVNKELKKDVLVDRIIDYVDRRCVLRLVYT